MPPGRWEKLVDPAAAVGQQVVERQTLDEISQGIAEPLRNPFPCAGTSGPTRFDVERRQENSSPGALHGRRRHFVGYLLDGQRPAMLSARVNAIAASGRPKMRCWVGAESSRSATPTRLPSAASMVARLASRCDLPVTMKALKETIVPSLSSSQT